MERIGIIILAAGSSSRFNGIKQLAVDREKTLIRHAVLEARLAEKNTIVVVGANFESVVNELADLDARVVLNSSWQEGMSSSIRCGLNFLLQRDMNLEAAIFMVCDQP